MNTPIALIGNTGRMGAFFQQRFTTAGFGVRGVDREGTAPLAHNVLQHACAGASVVLLCVPALALGDVIRAVVPYMEPHAVLADITSVKVRPMAHMEAAWTGPVVGTHPLFGPLPELTLPNADMPVALTPGQHATPEAVACITDIFTRIGCRVFVTTAQEHDRAMAALQGLNFISSLAYFAALAGQKELLPFLTPSFVRRKDAAQKQLTEDAALFEGIFEANPYSQELVRQYRAYLNLAAAGDIGLLTQRAAWWWPKAGEYS